MSEKLDGIRALWNGEHFITRSGNIIVAPESFTKYFPSEQLDGELWYSNHEMKAIFTNKKY